MKLPKHIDIFGRKIKIIRKNIRDTGRMGYYDDHRGEIVVCSTITESKDIESTWVHELVHALMFRLGYHQVVHGQASELFCENFATFIYENFEPIKR